MSKSFVTKKIIKNLIVIVIGLQITACSDKQKSQAEIILEQMSLEEKIGQVIQADIGSVTPEEVQKYNLGSILNGGNSAPGGGKTAEWQEWVALADAMWLASTDTSDGGVGIPAIWGTDAVHGHNNLQSATIFPHNIGLGATRDTVLLEKIGAVTAHEVRATGLDWVFAPTVAVARDYRWGRTYESYSENPQLVSDLGAALILGLQGKPGTENYLGDKKIIATAKHFVGDGGTQYGIDKGDTIVTEQELRNIHAYPYKQAFQNDVQSVMASFSSVNGTKMHENKPYLTDLLRDEMNFNGFVVGDWNGHAEIPGCSATNCPDAFLAGVDMYMAPESWKGIYESFKSLVESGDVPMARLDEAVLRILQAKVAAGIFEAGLPSQRPETKQESLGIAEHRAVAREAVRKSLVLLKNNNQALPIEPKANVMVVGAVAKSMKHQTGGWTLSWQGNDNANDEFKTGETIYSGLEAAITQTGGTISWSPDGSYEQKPDAAIVVFGEDPYAEFHGDRMDLIYEFEGDPNLNILKQLKADGVPVVAIFISGRPLWINSHINLSDAFVAAWLPGTEAGGIADVIVASADGSPQFDFVGKLPFSWPVEETGQLVRKNDGSAFQFGYGLSYGDDVQLAALPVSDVLQKPEKVFSGQILAKGKAVEPLEFYLGDLTNSNTPAPMLNLKSLGGSLTSSGTDYQAQEDSRRLSWVNDNFANASARLARPFNITQMPDYDLLALSMTLKLSKAGDDEFIIGMICGEACIGSLAISSVLTDLPRDEWQEVRIPFSCFVSKGLDPTKVEVPLFMQAKQGWELSVHNAELVSSDELTSCPQ
ncbi:MAG: glycoside hydrolase family 3 N-terminal domain-containing protein [Candidatus Micropelagos thuwalensis]